jgi:uncharacterized protein DUF6962
MTELDVTLTDYVLCAECAAFAWLIARRPANLMALRRWTVLFFVFTALAALSGGTVHGFYAPESGSVGRVLWKISMLAIGATAQAAWAIGAYLLFDDHRRRIVLRIAATLTAAYAAVIVSVTDEFWVAVAGYLPAAAFLLAAFLRGAVRRRASWAKLGACALALSFAAAAIQQLRIALHPVYFNHNALYHLVQAVALALLFIALRRSLGEWTESSFVRNVV